MKRSITWYAADGYVGGDRPHKLTVHMEHFDESQTVEEVEEELRQALIDDFNDKVQLSYEDNDVRAMAESIVAELRGGK